jgi:hypothetical protein
MAVQGNTLTGSAPSLSIQNNGTTDLVLTPGTTWLTTPNTNVMPVEVGQNMETPLSRNALRTLITITSKLEEFFEYKYHLHPVANSYSSNLSFTCDIRKAQFVVDSSIPVEASWSEPIFEDVRGDINDEPKASELIQATAKIIYGVMCFRNIEPSTMYTSPVREPLKDSTRAFLIAIAKGFVIEDAEVPEEALGKLALLSF